MNEETVSARQSKSFLTIEEAIERYGANNTILDFYSVLIGSNVSMGKGNIFYPDVIIECRDEGAVSIGDDNVFYPGTFILSNDGPIRIGDSNEFGTSGCTIKTFKADTSVVIGNGGRYCDGVSISGATNLGSGSQIMGAIVAQNCSLEAGGTYLEPDPDKRAGVLKGFGLARNIKIGIGQVVNGSGNFADAPVEWQQQYHPKVSE